MGVAGLRAGAGDGSVEYVVAKKVFPHFLERLDNMEGIDDKVGGFLVKLSDALCELERNCGPGSVLIVRMADGFVYRAMDGKPVGKFADELTDNELIGLMLNGGQRGEEGEVD